MADHTGVGASRSPEKASPGYRRRDTLSLGSIGSEPRDNDKSLWMGSIQRGTSMTPEAITITLQVIEALEELNIDYLIGGSFASTLHGMPRATMDADLVADLRFEHIPSFVDLLQEDFYMDAKVIRDAIKNRGSFNLIHLLSAFKIDIFILGKRPFDLSEFSRRKLEQILSELPRSAYVKIPEDAVLSKLEWFKMGGELSELQ